MFFTVVVFLWTLANYIFFVAFCAIILSFTFLLPLLMICGPQGEQGDLRALLRFCRAKCTGNVSRTSPSAPPSAAAATTTKEAAVPPSKTAEDKAADEVAA